MTLALLAAALAAAPAPAAAPRAAAPPAATSRPAAAVAAAPVAAVLDAERALRGAIADGEGRERLAAIAARWVDYEAVARRSTGPAWRRLSPRERGEIVAALRALLEERFLAGLVPGERPGVTATLLRRRGDEARVRVLAPAGAGQQAPVDLDLARDRRLGWRVRDAVVSGVAVLEGYREQLPQLLDLGGVPRLVQQLEAERRELAARHAAAPRPAGRRGPAAHRPGRGGVASADLTR